MESVLFVADARVSWRTRGVSLAVCARSVLTHQPHCADAEALLLYVRNQATTREYDHLHLVSDTLVLTNGAICGEHSNVVANANFYIFISTNFALVHYLIGIEYLHI